MDSIQKTYLGDGVYVDYSEGGYVLTAENGMRTNTIYLEPSVYQALVDYHERVKELLAEEES